MFCKKFKNSSQMGKNSLGHNVVASRWLMKLLVITTVDKRDNITGVWRRLNNKELYDLCFSCKYYWGDQIKKNEMGESCGRCGGKVYTGFRWGDLRERDHLEDLDLHGRIILKQIFKKWDGEAWTSLICLRIGTRGWALVNAVINLRISESAGYFLTGQASQEGLCSMEIVS